LRASRCPPRVRARHYRTEWRRHGRQTVQLLRRIENANLFRAAGKWDEMHCSHFHALRRNTPKRLSTVEPFKFMPLGKADFLRAHHRMHGQTQGQVAHRLTLVLAQTEKKGRQVSSFDFAAMLYRWWPFHRRRNVAKQTFGRGDRIRTCDPLLPKQMRYQAAPLPDGCGP
jgi:hypothetical protein